MKKLSEREIDRFYGVTPEKISPHLWLQYVSSGNEFENDLIWRTHIVLDDSTTAKELRESWGKVDAARQELKLLQGSDPKQFSVSLMATLVEQKKKWSYGVLAKDLNFDALTYLLWLSDESKGAKEQIAGSIIFVNLFDTLGFKNEDLREWLQEGKNKIKQGRAPWGVSNGPITRIRVVHAFERYQDEIKSMKIVLPPSFNPGYIETIQEFAYVKGCWKKAENLLQKENSADFKKYSNRHYLRLNDLILRISRKSGLNSE